MQAISSEKIKQLKQKQESLRSKIILNSEIDKLNIIAGCDSSLIEDKYIFSIFITFSYPSLELIEIVHEYSEIEFPYIPGLLSFREIPNLLKTYKRLKNKPDLIMVDGNGIIHPRRMGIASHLGIKLNKPTIGIAKKLLLGYFKEPNKNAGSYSSVYDYQQEEIGYALRSKEDIKPIYVSPGHLVSIEDSLKFTLKTLRGYKLPEPTRLADKYSNELKREVLPI